MVNENIKQFIKNENNLIIETHTPSVLEDIDLDLIFYLKRPIKDIISVYKVRGYSQNKIQENIDCINLDNVLDECIDFLRDPKIIEMDCLDRAVQEVVDCVSDKFNINKKQI